MPKQTFYNLSQEKKDKIIEAARKEYARVPVSEVSIQNIVEDAKIARGSFYQYFEDKSDLLEYIVSMAVEETIDSIAEKLEKTEDIFETYLYIYDEIILRTEQNDSKQICKMLFRDLKVDDTILENIKQKIIIVKMKNLMEIIKSTNIKDKSIEDIRIIVKILNGITMQAIACYVKSDDKDKSKKREEFVKELNFIKYGVITKDNK